MSAGPAKRKPGSRKEGGFTLIELMIALLLGLLVMGAAIAIFLSNRQAYTATEGLGRVQENVRFAFELMARDIREVGANPCGRHVPVVNVVTGSSANWWTDLNSEVDDVSGELVNPWYGTLEGFTGGQAMPSVDFGGGAAQRVNGTEAILLNSADDAVYSVQSHNPGAATFTLSTSSTNLESNSLVIVCDARQASIFRAASVSGPTISHTDAGGLNCTSNLGLPADCATATAYNYQPNAMVARLGGAQWYIGNNGRDGTSLYQSRITADGSGVTTQEIVEGVESLNFEFLQDGAADYVTTATITSAAGWAEVIAVRLTLGMRTEAQGGTTDGQPLRRTLTHVVSLRSRNP